jgi:hypothetical protein
MFILASNGGGIDTVHKETLQALKRKFLITENSNIDPTDVFMIHIETYSMTYDINIWLALWTMKPPMKKTPRWHVIDCHNEGHVAESGQSINVAYVYKKTSWNLYCKFK